MWRVFAFGIPFFAGCATNEVAWGVNHASVLPNSTGFSGTQTWEFFSDEWTPAHRDRGFICARVQTLTGVVAAAPTCASCDHIYTVTVDELDSDCKGDLPDDPSFATPAAIGIGDVPGELVDDAPHPDRSLGWYFSTDGKDLKSFGWAWDEALDYDGDPGPPGFVADRPYTLWPASAWQL